MNAPRNGSRAVRCAAYRHLAAAEGCYSVVVWLLKQGAIINAVDRFKRTPLEV